MTLRRSRRPFPEVRMIAVRPVARTVQSLTLFALPHGGQRVARRNAWASMSAESAWARSRRVAELAMQRALTTSGANAVREHATR
jgi:hypothetical protein